MGSSVRSFRHRTPIYVVGTMAAFVSISLGAAAENARRDDANTSAAQSEKPPFLIIAPRNLAPSLDAFVTFRTREFETRVETLDEAIKGEPGIDDAERLKHHLFEAWKSGHARYVLLVGDADILPVRYMCLDRVTPEAFDYSFYPCDLYYADLAKPDGAFDDWNAQKGDVPADKAIAFTPGGTSFHARYFGEVRGEKNKADPINFDSVDYRQEVSLARWPVSTPEEVQIVASKTIAYEESLTKRTPPNAAFIAVGGWIENRPSMDEWASMLTAPWSVDKRYWGGEASTLPTEASIVELLNKGTRLIVHSGHGNDDCWDQCIGTWSLGKVHNASATAVMMSAGCSTARFATLPPYEPYTDWQGYEHAGTNAGQIFTIPPPAPACYQRGRYNPTGLGEQLLRRGPDGAVAYIGCNTGSQPAGMSLARGFVRAIATRTQKHEPARLGDCWSDAIREYYDAEGLATIRPDDGWYPPSIFFQGMKFMVFGDPTLRIE